MDAPSEAGPASFPPDDFPAYDAPETAALDATAGDAVSSQRIGRYKLLQPIGEGGFGTVFLAEQVHPVRRRVALKIIKLGMDTRQVIARFDAERQALAMMEHPNIARVFDAGATDTGRPYFVMELVKGIPITEYCDAQGLSTRLRLDLFIHVCQAIQHAHQKGIIHRDIKPSNLLVTLHDGKPVPKVIDFGIAKATNFDLTEKTLFTEHRQMIGTPAYMSPEQAEMSGLDIDTRSDIYSLGVLLYELLTGTTPFDSKDLLKAGMGEIQKIIREQEPPKPSTRISTMGDKVLTLIARQRGIEPRRLSRALRGDIDWIVMKCLEKDRMRRYETADALAQDVQRHLDNEPVVARSPSRAYRLQKLLRRNKVLVTAVAAVLLALVMGIGGTTEGMIRARTSQRASDSARQDAILQKNLAVNLLEDVKRAKNEAEKETRRAQAANGFMRSMLTSARPTTQPFGNSTGDSRAGADVRVADVLEQAGNSLERFADQPELELDARLNLASTFEALQLLNSAQSNYQRALVLSRKLAGDDAEQTMTIEVALESLTASTANESDARALAQRIERFLGPGHPLTFDARNVVAMVLLSQKKLGDAEGVLRDLVQRLRDHPTVVHPKGGARYISNLALVLRQQERFSEAATLQREALARSISESQTDPARSMTFRTSLVTDLLREGKLEEAAAIATAAVAYSRATLGFSDVRTIDGMQQLAGIDARLGQFDQSVTLCKDTLKALTPIAQFNVEFEIDLRYAAAEAALHAGRVDEARVLFAEARAGALKAVQKQPDLFDKVRSDWAFAELLLGAGVEQTWAGAGLQQAVITPLWDAIHRHSWAVGPPEPDWPRFHFRMQSWTGKSNAEPQIVEGGLNDLHVAADPPMGLYFLSLEVPRLATFPMRSGNWMLFSPWECDVRNVNSDTDMNDAAWEAILAAPPVEHYRTMSLNEHRMSHLAWGYGPRRSQTPFVVSATSSLKLPAGSYRLHVYDRCAGCRLWVDGELIYDGWRKDPGAAPVVAFGDEARSIKVNRWSHGTEWFSLTAEPLGPAAQAMAKATPGWRYFLDADLEKLDGDSARRPLKSSQRRDRSTLFCRTGRFLEASADLARLLADDPENALDAYRQLCLLAYLDQRPAYQTLSRDAVKRYAEYPDMSEVERIGAAMLLLATDQGGFTDLPAVAPFVDKPLASGGRLVGWYKNAKGLHELRLGHFDAAADWFAQANSDLKTSKYGSPTSLLGRSIALWRSGQKELASQCFQQAEDSLREIHLEPGKDELPSGDINGWLTIQVLEREAAGLISAPPATTREATTK